MVRGALTTAAATATLASTARRLTSFIPVLFGFTGRGRRIAYSCLWRGERACLLGDSNAGSQHSKQSQGARLRS